MDELEQVRNRVREAVVCEPPEPWRTIGIAPITGITEVGFGEDDHSELLLVLSGHGREIIDCASGRLVGREKTTEYRSSWYGVNDLVGNGFGPLNGRKIALSGASGGGMPAFTRDGWGAVRAAVDWPVEHLLLTAPFSSIYQPTSQFWKLAIAREPAAFGFSHSGNTLIAVTEEGVMVFARG